MFSPCRLVRINRSGGTSCRLIFYYTSTFDGRFDIEGSLAARENMSIGSRRIYVRIAHRGRVDVISGSVVRNGFILSCVTYVRIAHRGRVDVISGSVVRNEFILSCVTFSVSR